MLSFTLGPIGFVSSSVRETVDSNWAQIASKVLLQEEFRGGLQGLEEFSHAVVVTYLHQASYEAGRHLRRRPRDLPSMPEVGIFAQRARHRPNPIGVTAVKIVAVTEDSIEVVGLDAIDGTPVLDIKPYYPHFDRIQHAKVPRWVDLLMEGYF